MARTRRLAGRTPDTGTDRDTGTGKDRRTDTNLHPTSLRSILASDSTGPRSSPSPGDGDSPREASFREAAFLEEAFPAAVRPAVALPRAGPRRREVEPRCRAAGRRAHRH